jgi:putative glutamine amidotransferase
MPSSGHTWDEALEDIDGVVFLGQMNPSPRVAANEERLCHWCRDNKMPLLAVDRGLHALNSALGGTLHLDLPRELPLALQHRHPPEPGVRHAIVVTNGTRLAQLYGEGEIVVNSAHTRAVNRVARISRDNARIAVCRLTP